MIACAMCRRVESISPMMKEKLGVDMVGVRLCVPDVEHGFHFGIMCSGGMVEWHDGPCGLCIEELRGD